MPYYSLIFLPILAHQFLILYLYYILGRRRFNALKTQEVDLKQVALDCKAWPEDVIKVSNNLDNQFALPIIFYMLCLIIFLLKLTSPVILGLAWLFVISRYAHSYIHCTSNFVAHRYKLFVAGAAIVLILFAFVSLYALAGLL